MLFLDEKRETDEKYISFFIDFNILGFVFFHFGNFRKRFNGRYEKSKYQKNSPEMNVSDRDLFPVKILSKSVEKQKSYGHFSLQNFFLEFFDFSGST